MNCISNCRVKNDSDLPIDKGYAWVIVAAGTFIFLLGAGGFKNQGIIMVEVIERFEEVYSPSTLLYVFTLSAVVGSALNPLAGYMTVKLGRRSVIMFAVITTALSHIGLAYAKTLPAMLILYTIPSGFGYITCVIVSVQVVRPYFVKKKALAMGIIAGVGGGAGNIILPNILRPLFDGMDYSGALLMYAGVNLQFLWIAALLRPITYYTDYYDSKTKSCDTLSSKIEEVELKDRNATGSEKTESAETAQVSTAAVSDLNSPELEGSSSPTSTVTEKMNLRILLMPKFMLIGVTIVLTAVGVSVFFNTAPALGRETGVSKDSVALVMTLTALVEIVGRTANGFLADRKIMSALLQYSLCQFGAGFFVLLGGIFSGLPGVALGYLGVVSMATTTLSLMPIVIAELIGEEHVTNGMSMQQCLQAIGMTATTFISGYIYDQTGSWRYVFYYIASALMSASMISGIYILVTYCKSKRAGKSNQSLPTA